MELNEKIQILRKNKNMSQEKLADKLNISRQAVQKWENGESLPDISNLIQLSNIFNITLDRLLKDDDCVNIINNQNHSENQIINFLILAKKNTYAGNAKEEEKPTRPESHDLIYEQDNYKYFDTYLGGERFIGEEAVFIDNNPVWAMNYNGIEINEKFSGNFLKQALSNVDANKPYRGPEIFKDGNYTYVCKVNGTFNNFYGEEAMYCQNEKVYTCAFSGGIIK